MLGVFIQHTSSLVDRKKQNKYIEVFEKLAGYEYLFETTWKSLALSHTLACPILPSWPSLGGIVYMNTHLSYLVQ